MVRDADELEDLRRLYAAKAQAEQQAADALVPGIRVLASGEATARVLLVKGDPGEADLAAGEALAGPDGDAALAALAALGVGTASVLALVTRPAPGTSADAAVERLARYLESADPAVAVALDGVAAGDLAAAAGLAGLPFGSSVLAHGRVLLAVDGLEASLADEARKKRVWAQFRGLTK
ncbi:MAG TPA: hypothetical protein VGK50_06430 [Coriobacteriia bacterium]|jgi:hypothetical protein